MTNIFTTSALIKVVDEYYNLAVLTMRAQQQNTRVVPKALLYTIGSTIIATIIIYKSVKAIVPRHLDYTGTEFITKGQTSASTSSSLSFNFLSTAIKSLRNVFKYKKTVTKQPETLFENKYFKEYDEWIEAHPISDKHENKNVIMDPVEEQHKKECLENMYYSTVREKINDFYGDVIMCYDHATFSFAYYARTGNIPYKYLETISRKYMIETNAPREIHVDIRNEYKKAKERITNTNTNTNNGVSAAASTAVPSQETTPSTTTDASSCPAETDVFVKLKSYNTASNLNLHTTTNDAKEKTHKFVGSTANANNIDEMDATNASAAVSTNNKVIREKANRYSYRGKLDDFEEHHKTFLVERRKAASAKAEAEAGTAGATKEHSVSSYAEYKKQMMKSV